MRKSQLLLVVGQVIGQVAFLAALPILTRMYSPAELGDYQLALAIGLLVQPLATLRIEMVIPSTGTHCEVQRLRRIATSGIVIVTGSVAIASLATWLATGSYPAFGASALIVLAYTSMAMDNALLIRARQLNRLIARNMLSGLLSAVIQVTLSLLWVSAYSLAVGVLVGRGVAILATRYRGSAQLAPGEAAGNWSAPWTARRGILSTGAALIAAGNGQVLRIFTAFGYGPSAVGQVGVAQQAASAPLALVSQGLAQFTQAELAPLVREGGGDLRRALRRQILLVMPFAVVTTAALAVLGPMLAAPVFGEEWAGAGVIIAILAVPSGLQLLTAPLMSVFVMLALEHVQFRLQALRLALIIFCGVAAILFASSDVRALVAGYAIGNSVAYLIILFVLQRIVRNREN